MWSWHKCGIGSIPSDLYSVHVLPLIHKSVVKKMKKGNVLHPLSIGAQAFSYLYEGMSQRNFRYISTGMNLVKALDSYPFQSVKNGARIFYYGMDKQFDKSGRLKAGKWWSGMAQSSIALAYLAAYQINGNVEYKKKALETIDAVILPLSKGGAAIKISDNAFWYLEYASSGTNLENANFVLNGFSYSMVALHIFRELVDRKRYGKAYDLGINALKIKIKKYTYGDLRWSYYQLTPKVNHSFHYAVLDIILLEILDSISPDSLIKQSLRDRRIVIKNAMQIERNKREILFSFLGVPHTYWIDYFPITVVIELNDSSVDEFTINPNDNIDSGVIRLFKSYTIPAKKEISTVSVYIARHSRKVLLFEEREPKVIITNSGKKCCAVIPYEISTKHDAETANETIVFGSAKKTNRATLRFILNEPINLYKARFFGIRSNLPVDVYSIRVSLITVDNRSVSRYYMKQSMGDDNVMLLMPISFVEYETFHNKDVKEIRVSYNYRLSDEQIRPGENLNYKAKELFYCTTNHQIRKYFSSGLYRFQEKPDPL